MVVNSVGILMVEDAVQVWNPGCLSHQAWNMSNPHVKTTPEAITGQPRTPGNRPWSGLIPEGHLSSGQRCHVFCPDCAWPRTPDYRWREVTRPDENFQFCPNMFVKNVKLRMAHQPPQNRFRSDQPIRPPKITNLKSADLSSKKKKTQFYLFYQNI